MQQNNQINIVSVQDIFKFIEDLYLNYDCDEDAHKYGYENSQCRACRAKNLLTNLGIKLRY